MVKKKSGEWWKWPVAWEWGQSVIVGERILAGDTKGHTRRRGDCLPG